MTKLYSYLVVCVISLLAVFNVAAQQCDVIYVTPNGSGTGSRTSPASLQTALTLVTPTSTRLWLAVGQYDIATEIQLVNNITIEGGFDPATWVKSNTPATVIHRLNGNLLPAPANATGVFAGLNVSGFRLQDLTLTMDLPNGVAATAYGIYLNGCSNYNIVRVDVTAADGTPGVAGTPGTPGAAGTAGQNGAAGNPNETGRFVTTPGGTGGNPGGVGAGNGGHSGSSNAPSTVGSGACGGTAGANGTGPQCNLGCTFGSPNCNQATAGSPGGAGCAGTNGTAGAVGPAGTITFPGYFVPGAAGGNGNAGVAGSGGGGGGGGGGRQNSGTDDVGGAGGGGGGGGFGGNGGNGGTGGGGSFAVFLYNNGAGGNIVDCRLIPGAGGAGGTGGGGGTGGAGGAGGQGGAAGCGPNPGGNGGAGGAGGAGGTGGAGATGLSQALYVNGNAPNQSNITSVPGNPPVTAPPVVISVNNYGCTNAEVVFTAPVSGTWNFGAGATPATGNGTGPVSVMYGTTGRKTITYNGTAYTDFVDIFNNQTNASSITHVNVPAVVGCPDTFKTTLTGSLYEWNFGPNAIPPVVVGPTAQNAPVAFTAPGTYTVVLWVTTPCCGRIKDSLTLTVQPNTLNITLTASTNSICQGSAITYTATPASYLGYTFLVNNTPAQTSPSNTFTTTTLAPGDSVTVLGFDGVCFSNPSSTLFPIVTPTPTVTLTSSDADNTICEGDQVTFTASPTGYTSYNFFNNSNQAQSTASETYTTVNLTAPTSTVYVVAVNNGCSSAPSSNIITTVNSSPGITLTASPNPSCTGDNVTVTANPAGLDNYDFTVNSSSVQNNATNTYSSATFNNGDVVAVSGSLNGCTGQATPVTITVNPIPSVTLTSSDSNDSICQGETVTFTATPAGMNNYEFFNNGSSLQNGASNTYLTNQLLSGNSVTVVATNLGCVSPPSNAIVTEVRPSPVVDAGANLTSCIDAGQVTLTGFSPAGGNWTGTGVTNGTNGDFDPAVAGAGTFTLVYGYADPALGCTGYDSITYTVNPLPVPVVQSAISICDGESAQLTASGGSTYAWSPGGDLSNPNIANPTATPSTNTTYTVTVTDQNLCSNTATTTVNVNPRPVADFTADQVCSGNPTTFTNLTTPAGTYTWYFGDGATSTISDPQHTYAAIDTFTVTLIAQLGNCFDTAVNNASVYPGAVAAFFASPLQAYNDGTSPVVFTDQSENTDTWFWDFGDQTNSSLQSPAHLYQDPGIYSITLVSSNQYGCSDTATRENYIRIYQMPKVFVPNAFTPNGDGNNDVLLPFTQGAKFFEFKIFNRWGEKVFESNNTTDGWDGRYQGKEAQPGVYTYTLKLVFEDNSVRPVKGSITLMK